RAVRQTDAQVDAAHRGRLPVEARAEQRRVVRHGDAHRRGVATAEGAQREREQERRVERELATWRGQADVDAAGAGRRVQDPEVATAGREVCRELQVVALV